MRKFGLSGLILGLVMAVSVEAVEAGPHFTLSPASGSYTNGSTFSITLGVDSGVEKVIAMDVVASFDATKLEVTSITKASIPDDGFQFSFTPIIKNDTGRFEMTLAPLDSSVYNGKVVQHALLTVNFRAKAVGTASVNFVCQTGQVNESNIINQTSNDVADCTANQSGSYTITAATAVDTPAATASTPTNTPRVTGSLPQTGSIGSTVGLAIFGIVSVMSALLLRWL